MRIFNVSGLFVAAAILAACGGGGGSSKTAVSSPSATASAERTAQSTATKAASSVTAIAPSATAEAAAPTTEPPTAAPPPVATSTEAPPPPPPPPPPPAGGSVSIVAKDVLFQQVSLTAAAGPLTVNFDNQDAGVVHNVHFFDAGGGSAGETDLISGPASSSVTFTVAPGRYTYKCDVHPAVMRGVLTVS